MSFLSGPVDSTRAKDSSDRIDREAGATRKPKTIGGQSEGCSDGSSDQLDRKTILAILQRDRHPLFLPCKLGVVGVVLFHIDWVQEFRNGRDSTCDHLARKDPKADRPLPRVKADGRTNDLAIVPFFTAIGRESSEGPRRSANVPPSPPRLLSWKTPDSVFYGAGLDIAAFYRSTAEDPNGQPHAKPILLHERSKRATVRRGPMVVRKIPPPSFAGA